MSADFWNTRYRESEPVYGTEPNAFLASEVDRLKPGGSVLCLGEGEGRNAVFLASQGMDVTALDYAEAGLERTRELAASRHVTVNLVHADLSTHELSPASFDAVVAIFVHLPPPLRTKVHQAVLRALRPGGVFLAEYFSKDQLRFSSGGPKDPSLLYTVDDVRADFTSGTIERIEQTEVDLREGRYHQGRASVIRVVVSQEA
jgi:SAM-dependent methyltransferase